MASTSERGECKPLDKRASAATSEPSGKPGRLIRVKDLRDARNWAD